MPGRDIIVIGASAGGVEALIRIAGSLPPDLPAAVFVVLHISPHGTSVLPDILHRAGKLPAKHPEEGEPIVGGQIYVAPPDRHMLVRGHRIHLSRGPAENSSRPAIDPLFRSAATSFGPRVVGVILSGVLDDGTAGLIAIKRRGGVAVVQDPEEALFNGMPSSAIANVAVDRVLPVVEIGPALARLIAEQPDEAGGIDPMSGEIETEVRIDDIDEDAMRHTVEQGPPSALTCPECNGALWETQDGHLVRYRCRVGHAYSEETLFAEQNETLEAAMWQAFRALKESAAFARRLAERSRERGNHLMVERYRRQEQDAEYRAGIMRLALRTGHAPTSAVLVHQDAD